MQGMQTRQRQITILPLNLHAMMVLRMSASFISCSCALNVPQESVEAWITSNADQALDTPIAAYCYSGARSGRAVVKFLAAGFNYSTNAGGYEDAKVEMEQVCAHTLAHMQIHLRIHILYNLQVCEEAAACAEEKQRRFNTTDDSVAGWGPVESTAPLTAPAGLFGLLMVAALFY
jgi:hypothetical protein